jgi:hypothetical protein
LRIVSSVLTPHPQPLLVRKMQSFNWCFKKNIYGYYFWLILLKSMKTPPLIPVELLYLDTLVHTCTDYYIHKWACLQGP